MAPTNVLPEASAAANVDPKRSVSTTQRHRNDVLHGKSVIQHKLGFPVHILPSIVHKSDIRRNCTPAGFVRLRINVSGQHAQTAINRNSFRSIRTIKASWMPCNPLSEQSWSLVSRLPLSHLLGPELGGVRGIPHGCTHCRNGVEGRLPNLYTHPSPIPPAALNGATIPSGALTHPVLSSTSLLPVSDSCDRIPVQYCGIETSMRRQLEIEGIQAQ